MDSKTSKNAGIVVFTLLALVSAGSALLVGDTPASPNLGLVEDMIFLFSVYGALACGGCAWAMSHER